MLLISLDLPGLVVNLFGQRIYSAFDNIMFLANLQGENGLGSTRDDAALSDLRSVYPDSSSAFILSIMVLYPISIAIAIAAVIFTALGGKYVKKRSMPSAIALGAGIFAIVAGVTWIYSIESFKAQFSRDAELSGGIIGEEWKGNANLFVDRLIVMGVGHYVVIAAGVIAVFSRFIVTHKHESNQNAMSEG